MKYYLKDCPSLGQSKQLIQSVAYIETDNISTTIKAIPLFRHPLLIYRLLYAEKDVIIQPVSVNHINLDIEHPLNAGTFLLFLFSYSINYLINENRVDRTGSFVLPAASTPEDIAGKIVDTIWAHLSPIHQKQKKRITDEALRLMQKHEPGTNATAIARRLRISSRHLRRLVKQQTGLTPKIIIRLSRLKDTYLEISQGIPTERSLFSNGYYDFSHFTKDSQSLLHLKPHSAIADTSFLKAVGQLFKDQNSIL